MTNEQFGLGWPKMFWSHVSKLHAHIHSTNEGVGMGQPPHPRNLPLLGVVSCVLDPPHCRRQVSAPCSTVREEAWGVGGLCKLAKGVYTEIQAWETNGHKRKTFIHKQHHMLDFKARGVSVHEKLSFLLHSKKNRWCHTRKSLWRNSILLSLLEPTAHHSGYFKEIPWSSLLVRLLSSWYPFHLRREEILVNSRGWRLESILGRTVKSVYLSPLAAIKKHHSLGGSNSRKEFSHSFRSPRAGCHHAAFLWGPFSLFIPGTSIKWNDIMFPSASGLFHWV